MKLIKNYCTQSRAYSSTRRITPKGIMIHSVGTPQPSAEVFQRIWNKPTAQVITHAVVDAKDQAIQCLPWTHRAWHARYSANDTHISVEMTEPATIKYISGSNWQDLDEKSTKAHVMATYRTSVELFAYICNLYNFDPMKQGVIVSHAEGYKLGIASNHGDPEHIWRKFGLTMDQFRKDIAQEMKKGEKKEEEVGVNPETERVKDIQRKLIALGYTPNGGVDGLYGPGTTAAVKSFQRDNGLTVDGSAGPITMGKMNQLIEKGKEKEVLFRVVVGSFNVRKNAEIVQKELKKVGIDTFLAAYKNEDGTLLLRVIAGTYAERDNAVKRQEVLKKLGHDSFLLAYKEEKK